MKHCAVYWLELSNGTQIPMYILSSEVKKGFIVAPLSWDNTPISSLTDCFRYNKETDDYTITDTSHYLPVVDGSSICKVGKFKNIEAFLDTLSSTKPSILVVSAACEEKTREVIGNKGLRNTTVLSPGAIGVYKGGVLGYEGTVNHQPSEIQGEIFVNYNGEEVQSGLVLIHNRVKTHPTSKTPRVREDWACRSYRIK